MQNLIKQIVEFSKKINSKEVLEQNFELFVKEFYHENKLTDFESYTTEALCNFAISSFKFLNFERKSGFNVRVYNPQKNQDNFEKPCLGGSRNFSLVPSPWIGWKGQTYTSQ